MKRAIWIVAALVLLFTSVAPPATWATPTRDVYDTPDPESSAPGDDDEPAITSPGETDQAATTETARQETVREPEVEPTLPRLRRLLGWAVRVLQLLNIRNGG